HRGQKADKRRWFAIDNLANCLFGRFGGTLSPISPQRLDPDRCRHLNKSQKKRAQPSHNAF
ncbi:hypothetical protein, partial [Aeromonas sp. ANNP30]